MNNDMPWTGLLACAAGGSRAAETDGMSADLNRAWFDLVEPRQPYVSPAGRRLRGEVGVAAVVGDKAGVGAGFDNLAMVKDDYLISVSHG